MRPLSTALLLTLLATTLSAQSPPQPEWEYWAGVDAVFTRDDTTLAPTLMADTERFHLEARYNYEGMNTTSLWGGYTVRCADGESWAVTPMLGAAFGDTRGVLPGAEAIVDWKALDVYLELEHLFSSGGESDDFTYYGAELAVSPTEWLRRGRPPFPHRLDPFPRAFSSHEQTTPRQLRLEHPGAIWHVTSRGNERRAIYRSDRDRCIFLDILADTVAHNRWILHACMLMSNHYLCAAAHKKCYGERSVMWS